MSKEAAWDKVHKAYDEGSGKIEAWNAVHRAYGTATGITLSKMNAKKFVIKKPEPAPEPPKKFVIKKPAAPKESGEDRMLSEIKSLVADAVKMAKEGNSKFAPIKFWNENISPKLDLYGAEYLGHGGASELADEFYDKIEAELDKKYKPAPTTKEVAKHFIDSDEGKAYLDKRRADLKEKAEKDASAVITEASTIKEIQSAILGILGKHGLSVKFGSRPKKNLLEFYEKVKAKYLKD